MTNTTYTQVYCTGLGHHSEMSYRKLRPVRQFLQWLKSQDDEQVLGRAVIGGFFMYPPPPVSLETYMKDRRGEPGFLMGAELQREIDGLCYRERRTFCIQATVTMVAYSHRGKEDHCLFWTDRSSSLPSSSPSSSSSSSRLLTPACHSPASRSTPSSTCSLHPLPSTPCSFRASPSSSSSAVSQVMPRLLDHRTRKSRKRKQLLTDTPRKRYPSVTLQPEHNSSASMEFLQNSSASEDEESDEEGASSFVTAPPIPTFPSVAMETLPLPYDHTQRVEQANVVAMGGRASRKFDSAFEDYYTLRLRALSDSVLVDVNFLPHLSSSHRHSNTWTSILSHGAFSSHTPPPSPADLISMATQLANQRLVCVLEACHLGGATTELILSRAFHLSD